MNLLMSCADLLLKSQNFVAINHKLSVALRVDELCVLPLQVGFGDPTGLRAATSDVNPHVAVHRELKQIFERGHAHAQNRIAHCVFYDQRSIVGKNDLDAVPGLDRAFSDMERHAGASGVVSSMCASDYK